MPVASSKFCITSVGGGSLNDYRRAAGRHVAVAGQQASGPLVDGVCLAMECAASLSAMITGGRVLVITALLVSTPVRWLSGSAGSVFQCITYCF
jgi:hypothetical protein